MPRPPCLGLLILWSQASRSESLNFVNCHVDLRSGRKLEGGGGMPRQVGGAARQSTEGVCEEAHVSVTRRVTCLP
eukprot:3866302-Rhodomonas_salina.1